MNPVVMKINYASIQNKESPTLFKNRVQLLKKKTVSGFPYRVDTEAVCVGDAEGVVLVCKDDDVGDWVDAQ